MKRMNDRLRVKKKRYYWITGVIIISFVVFWVISNFTYFLYGRTQQEDLSQLHNIDYDTIVKTLEEMDPNVYLSDSIETSQIILVGEKNDETVKYILQELKNIKQYYFLTDDVTKINLEKSPNIVILSKDSYSDQEQLMIDGLIEEGVNLIFTRLPNNVQVETSWGQKTFAVKSVNGTKSYKGLRVVSDFFISEMLELQDFKVNLTDVDLRQGCKVYAYSLMNKLSGQNGTGTLDYNLGENEELPPLIWRHIIGESEVFIVNGDFMETEIACGIINSIISKMSEVYIYPIINANSLFVVGFPYTENVKNDNLENLYSRDALGVQQDLIFPGIYNIVNDNGLFPGYYSENYEELLSNSGNKQLSYYMKEITKQTAELGYITDEGECVTLKVNADLEKLEEDSNYSDVISMLKNWESDFTFYNRKDSFVNIPIIEKDVHLTDRDIILQNAAVSSLGYLSDNVDVRVVLEPQKKNDEWVQFEKDFASLITYQQQKFGYLDKLNTEDIIKRIILFEILEPKIQYKTGKIIVNSKRFFGEANFILRTEYDLDKISGGTFAKIGNNAYLIYQQEETMTIFYKEEVK